MSCAKQASIAAPCVLSQAEPCFFGIPARHNERVPPLLCSHFICYQAPLNDLVETPKTRPFLQPTGYSRQVVFPDD